MGNTKEMRSKPRDGDTVKPFWRYRIIAHSLNGSTIERTHGGTLLNEGGFFSSVFIVTINYSLLSITLYKEAQSMLDDL